VDPLGLIKGLEENNAIEGFNGGKFSRKTHFVPSLNPSIALFSSKPLSVNHSDL
jgi:DNA polymerase-2